MSLCQSNGSSCGACCGLFNIDYPPIELKKILTERTKYFSENVDYSKRETVISYREDRTKSASERTEGPIEAELLIEKHRNGATGVVRLHFDDKKASYVSIDKQFGEFNHNSVPEADFGAGKVSDMDEF
jgi:hypothetical protein